MNQKNTSQWYNFDSKLFDNGPDLDDDSSVKRYIKPEARNLYDVHRAMGATPMDALRRSLLASIGESDVSPIEQRESEGK